VHIGDVVQRLLEVPVDVVLCAKDYERVVRPRATL
jgi:hypothetical protein